MVTSKSLQNYFEESASLQSQGHHLSVTTKRRRQVNFTAPHRKYPLLQHLNYWLRQFIPAFPESLAWYAKDKMESRCRRPLKILFHSICASFWWWLLLLNDTGRLFLFTLCWKDFAACEYKYKTTDSVTRLYSWSCFSRCSMSSCLSEVSYHERLLRYSWCTTSWNGRSMLDDLCQKTHVFLSFEARNLPSWIY